MAKVCKRKITHVTALITALFLSTSIAHAATSESMQTDETSQKALSYALEQANKNKDTPKVAGQYLHNAFDIAFQMGQYPLAKKLLAASVTQGVELAIWDNAALAEIFAREGNYVKAKERLSYAIESFKTGKCQYNPVWKKFQSALEKGDKDKIASLLDSQSSPSLIHTYPTVTASTKQSDAKFVSLDTSLPKEISVNLVIDNKGRVKCAAMDMESKQYSKMLLAIKKLRFNPAHVNDQAVWQYGKTYTIQHKKGHSMILNQITNAQSNYRMNVRNVPSSARVVAQ